jgi:hypothetical protein
LYQQQQQPTSSSSSRLRRLNTHSSGGTVETKNEPQAVQPDGRGNAIIDFYVARVERMLEEMDDQTMGVDVWAIEEGILCANMVRICD